MNDLLFPPREYRFKRNQIVFPYKIIKRVGYAKKRHHRSIVSI